MNEFGPFLGALMGALSDGVLLGIPMMFVLSKVKSRHGLRAAAGLAAVSYLVVIVPLMMFVVSQVPHLELHPIGPVFGLIVCVPLMLGMTSVLEQFKAAKAKRAESRKMGEPLDVFGAATQPPAPLADVWPRSDAA
jgi:MFS-type transporter involved in bile tolerance (Atg22 family)